VTYVISPFVHSVIRLTGQCYDKVVIRLQLKQLEGESLLTTISMKQEIAYPVTSRRSTESERQKSPGENMNGS